MGKLVDHWWEYKLMNPLGEKNDDSSKKLKVELPYDTTIPFVAIYLKKF